LKIKTKFYIYQKKFRKIIYFFSLENKLNLISKIFSNINS
jgi:hypothetical protein